MSNLDDSDRSSIARSSIAFVGAAELQLDQEPIAFSRTGESECDAPIL
jgi:hypothetical protein